MESAKDDEAPSTSQHVSCPGNEETLDQLNLLNIRDGEINDASAERSSLPRHSESPGNSTKTPILPSGNKASEFDLPPSSSQSTAIDWVEIINPDTPVSDFKKKVPNMAKEFPFELDNFQKTAIIKLEEKFNVLVTAHTSAGKTVVAEYAIALALKHKTKVIYASPVKALCNQKYRDFAKIFADVGLLTGDSKINRSAQCLIMTTEILRIMLHSEDKLLNDVEFVVLDEVHYINSVQRGFVWEEVIILLPNNCNIIMLSATTPNALEFASWIGKIKQKTVSVISTNKRPVNLHHFLYTGAGENSENTIHLLMDSDNHFFINAYDSANKSLLTKNSNKNELDMWKEMVHFLKTENHLPAVIFVLSRKRCNEVSNYLKDLDFTSENEKLQITTFFKDCFSKFEEYNTPQMMKMQQILKNGIGTHHSGMIPILKEAVELLFQRGLVKVLFATETFSEGINMSCRTVIFESIFKFENVRRRLLLPSEYIQMAGRSGRRGMDNSGTVMIVCHKEIPYFEDLKSVMLGDLTKLCSQYRITYSTILSLLSKQSSLSIETIMKNSFQAEGKPLYSEYEKKLHVLKHLGFVDAENRVTTKGQVACEFGESEIILTEIVFSNILNTLRPSEIAALLSCVLVEKKSLNKNKITQFTKEFMNAKAELIKINNCITKTEYEFEVGINGNKISLESRINFILMNTIYNWAEGLEFNSICSTEVEEGIIIRTIRRIIEVLIRMERVAKIMNDSDLKLKVDAVSQAITRDIMNITSLYTQNSKICPE